MSYGEFDGHLEIYPKIQYDYDKGFPGNREEPPEPAGIEVTAVFIEEDGRELDILDWLTKEQLAYVDKLAEEDWEKKNPPDDGGYADWIYDLKKDEGL